jgi:hypothetical protein
LKWGKVLKVSEKEKDLGVIMHKNPKPSRQCAEAAKGSLNFRYDKKDNSHQRQAYNTEGNRSQLEYCIQVWNPYLK